MGKININKIGIALLYMFIICIYCLDGDPKLNKIMYAVGVLFILVAIFSNRTLKRVPSNFAIDMLPFVLFCFCSCLWSSNPEVSLRRSITLFENFIVFWIMWVYIIRFKLQYHLIKAIALAGSVFAVYIVVYYGGLGSFIRLMKMADERTRIGGEVAHLSVIGQSLSISSVLTLALALKEKYWIRIIRFCFFVIQIIVVLASQSRTGLILVLFGSGLLLFEFMKRKGSKGGMVSVVLLVSICILLMNMIDLSSVLKRWEGVFSTGTKDSSSATRIAMIKEGFDFFLNRPVLGYGVGSSGSISIYKTYFHNNYVELLATTGLTGFILYYSVFIKAFYRIRKCARKKQTDNFLIYISFVCAVLLLVLMIFTVTYYVKYLYLIIVLLCSVSSISSPKIIDQDKPVFLENSIDE